MTHRITLPALAFLAAAPALTAQERPAPQDLSITVGAMAITGPSATGSDQRLNRAFPVLNIDSPTFFVGSNPAVFGFGAGLHLSRARGLTWDVGLGYGEGRKEHRAQVLAGMGDQRGIAWAGTALTARFGTLKTGVVLYHGLASDAGTLGRLEVSTSIPLARRWMAGAGLTATFADTKAMVREFGVSPEEAAIRQALLAAGDTRLRAGEARAFAPGGSLRDLTFKINGVHMLDARWSLIGMASLTHLVGDAGDGPLVRKRNTFSAGLGVGYKLK